MGTRWAPKAQNLSGYWGDRIAAMIAQDMAELGTDVLVNLASNEYWKAAQTHIPSPIRVISIDFREEGPNGLRFNSFAAKRARGMMRSEEHTSELQSLMRISYAVFCLKKKK